MIGWNEADVTGISPIKLPEIMRSGLLISNTAYGEYSAKVSCQPGTSIYYVRRELCLT